MPTDDRPGPDGDGSFPAVRSQLSPRHVPDEIHQVPGIPRTLSGKKLEVPVRRILLGTPVAQAADPDALANPEVLAFLARDGPRLPGGPSGQSGPGVTGGTGGTS